MGANPEAISHLQGALDLTIAHPDAVSPPQRDAIRLKLAGLPTSRPWARPRPDRSRPPTTVRRSRSSADAEEARSTLADDEMLESCTAPSGPAAPV